VPASIHDGAAVRVYCPAVPEPALCRDDAQC
jgi:hypothetical protein